MFTHKELIAHIDEVLPVAGVISQARDFLTECGWQLEVGWKVQVDEDGIEEFPELDNDEENFITIPEDVELRVRSRAFIKADTEDLFLDDHYEAVVLVGVKPVGDYDRAKYAVLRMYFNLEGQFVSEDRYNPHG
jgi:hypothetical protein